MVNSVVIFVKPNLTLRTHPLAQPFVKDHNEHLCYDRLDRYPLVVVKFLGIAPFKERVDHSSRKGFGKALRQKAVKRYQ
jgi:hypothetical protein